MRLKLVGESDCLAAPALFGIRVSVAENCGLTPFETSRILLLFPLLHEYAKSHPVKINAGCMVFAVRDDQIPLINMKPWISGMAFCGSIIHIYNTIFFLESPPVIPPN